LKLKQYLFSQISLSFIPIFFGLFFITSIVYLVKIAALTSVITMNVFELLTLYVYVVPIIVFYTLPISFFISMVLSLSKLSSEYELIVITSFGLNPLKIIKILFPMTAMLTISILIISMGLIPKAKHLTNTMLDLKKKEANFNIKESEFGQKFGDWLVYITDKNDKEYSDVKLFKTDGKTDQFILSKTAQLNNKEGELSFSLDDGKSFAITQKELNQIDFKSMKINSELGSNISKPFTNPIDHWKHNFENNIDIDDFVFYILTSIFPLLSLLLVISFGYFNPRYDKNKSIIWALSFVIFYYVGSNYLAKNVQLPSLYFVPVVWFAMTYFLYTKKVKEFY